MLERHVGEVGLHLSRDLAPHARGLDHVGLVHRGQLLGAAASQIEGQTHDALDLEIHVFEGVEHTQAALGLLAALLAEVQAAGQLTQDQHVAALDALALERRGVDQLGVAADGAQVGEQPEPFANREQALLGARLGVRIVPLRAADGAEHDRVRRFARGKGRRWQWVTGLVDGDAANQLRFEAELVAVARCDGFEHRACLPRHFGSNAITGEKYDLGFHRLHTLSLLGNSSVLSPRRAGRPGTDSTSAARRQSRSPKKRLPASKFAGRADFGAHFGLRGVRVGRAQGVAARRRTSAITRLPMCIACPQPP